MARYFVLAQRKHGFWSVAYSGYSRNTVDWERIDLRNQGVKPRDLKIINLKSARQQDIDDVIAALNSARAFLPPAGAGPVFSAADY